MTTITYRIENGALVETTTSEASYNQKNYVKTLETQIADMQQGLADNTASVNANIEALQHKLTLINNLKN